MANPDIPTFPHYPLPGAHLGGNHNPAGLILRNNTWHTSEHSLGRSSKNNNHLSNENQITEGRHTLIWQRETGILTQRGVYPLHSVRVCHVTISGQSVPGNNHDHGTMGKQCFPAVYPHPGQWTHQGYHYPHDNQQRLIHNTRNRSCLPHNREKPHRPTKDEPK